jgi:aminodeoxyfutalosine deaminase
MGLAVTVNSDDPPLFNTDLTHEYTILMDEYGYDLGDVARIARKAFNVSAMPPDLRSRLLAKFDRWVKDNVT